MKKVFFIFDNICAFNEQPISNLSTSVIYEIYWFRLFHAKGGIYFPSRPKNICFQLEILFSYFFSIFSSSVKKCFPSSNIFLRFFLQFFFSSNFFLSILWLLLFILCFLLLVFSFFAPCCLFLSFSLFHIFLFVSLLCFCLKTKNLRSLDQKQGSTRGHVQAFGLVFPFLALLVHFERLFGTV